MQLNKDDRLPCVKCGSTKGAFHTFFQKDFRYQMIYWMCECGRNRGHSSTEDGAIETWNDFQREEANDPR